MGGVLMKRIFGFLTVAAFAGMLFAANAFAQASGNFNYTSGPTACVLQSNGSITGGIPCGPISTGGACTTNANCTFGSQTCQGAISCVPGIPCATGGICDVSGFCPNTGVCSGTASKTCIGDTHVSIKTSTGKGNVFVVRPSAVIGLLTDVTVNSKQTTAISSALAGVDFSISIPTAPAGSHAVPIPNFPVTYDSRFIQISTNLFQGLSATCTASAGGCFITFNESTVSAHSFDWIIAPLTSGDYGVEAEWTASLANSGIATSMTCVGPLNFTIQQNKVFSPTLESSSDVTF
jgi:hypothetical protein